MNSIQQKLLVLFSVLTIIIISSNASYSTQYWAKTYGGGLTLSIQQTLDGGYITVGMDNILLLKLDSYGDISWQKTYAGSTFDAGTSILQTADGGFIMTCLNPLSLNFWLLKLESNGDITWQKTYGGNTDDVAQTIKQTPDGGYIVVGYTNSFGAGGSDAWILKLDSSGDVSWEKTYGGSYNDLAYFIQQTIDGGYIVAGNTESFGAGGEDIWILKIDSSGKVLWQKTYGGNNNDSAIYIYETIDFGFIVNGNTNSFGAGGIDAWILKLDSSGDVSWQKTYGRSGYDEAFSIQQTTDGGYIVAGKKESFDAGYYDMWLMKLDSYGDVSWQKTYGPESAYSIQEIIGEGYIMAGNDGSNIFLLKLDNNGDIPNCEIISTSDAIVSDTQVTGQDSDATISSTSANITDTSLSPQDSSVEATTICEGEIINTTTTTTNSSTTTTNINEDCFLKKIYDEHSEEIELLRCFRDNVLNQTPEGQAIIRLYYEWSPIIVKAMEEDEEFKEELKKMIDGVLLLVTEEAE